MKRMFSNKMWLPIALLGSFVLTTSPLHAKIIYNYDTRISPMTQGWVRALMEPSHATVDSIVRTGYVPLIAFWGMPDPGSGCSIRPNGTMRVVTDRPAKLNPYWANPMAEVGVNGALGVWTPECNGWEGFSYVAIGNYMAPGIGMGIWSGPKPWDPSAAFWMTYDASGDRTNNNKHHQAVQYHFPAPSLFKNDALKPWSGNSSNWDLLRYAIVTTQSMIVVSTPRSSYNNTTGLPTQAWQKINFNLTNKTCMNGSDPRRKCTIQIGITNIANKEGNPLTSSPYIMTDPAQGSMPVLEGSLGGPAIAGMLDGYGPPAYISWGAATQAYPFSSRLFQFEMSFNQFLNVLYSISVKNKLDLVTLFGSRYNDPNEWALSQPFISQEIINPGALYNRAYMSTRTESFVIHALP